MTADGHVAFDRRAQQPSAAAGVASPQNGPSTRLQSNDTRIDDVTAINRVTEHLPSGRTDRPAGIGWITRMPELLEPAR